MKEDSTTKQKSHNNEYTYLQSNFSFSRSSFLSLFEVSIEIWFDVIAFSC